MSGAAPWSVKGIEPRTREVAKDLARRSGMTLGEWLSEMISDNDEGDYLSDRRRGSRRLDDAYSMRGSDATSALTAIEALSARMEGAERRSTLAIDGVDRAVAGLVRRLEDGDAETAQRDRRIEEIQGELREGRARLRHFEEETGPRQVELFGKMEGALGKLAGQFYEAEARGRDAQMQLRDRMDRFEREHQPDRLLDGVVSRVASRLDEAQGRTAQALSKLEGSFADLDRRLVAAERSTGIDATALERLSASLTHKIEASRAEMLRRLDTAMDDGRVEKLERAVADLAKHIRESERRSAEAIEAMGREVMRIAGNLDGRLLESERTQTRLLNESQERSLRAVESMGKELSKSMGSDMARVAEAIEHRLRRGDDHHAMALEKLGSEITRISERLAERIAQGERRAAQGVDDLSEKLSRASEKMESRYDRASGELSERMRQSEERTARLLAEARESIDRQLDKRGQAEAESEWRDQSFPRETFDADWREPTVAFNDIDPVDVFEAAEPAFVAPVYAEPARSQEPDVFAAAAPAPAQAYAPVSEPEQVADTVTEAASFAPAPEARPEPSPFGGVFADAAGDLDAFEGETDFAQDRRPRGERPVSTREAIEAARAATRGSDGSVGADDQPRGFGFRLGGGKSRLQKRMDRQAKREGSTLKKALTATATAVGVVGLGAAGVVGYQRLVNQGSAIPGAAAPAEDQQLLAASAVAPSVPQITPPAAEAQAEGQRLFEQAAPLIEAGDAEGVRLMSRAANLGHPQAQLTMARLYETGEAGVSIDLTEARRWTERAARGGDSRAMHNLAMAMYEGTGGDLDQAAASRWFEQAAERGLVDSQYNLARLYERGAQGVEPDPVKAYQWYLIAGQSGDDQATAAAERLRDTLSATRRLEAEGAAQRHRTEAAARG